MTYDPAGAGYYSDPGAPASDEWSVSITDDDQRTMTSAQIVEEYQRGTLDLQDTFVWREGMGDWVALGESAELMTVLGGGGMSQPGYDPSQPGYAQPSYPGPPSADQDYGSTVSLDDHANAAGSSPGAAAVAAARRDAEPAADVFEQQAQPAAGGRSLPRPPRRVGERNEASSLFSIDDIQAHAVQRGPQKSRRPEASKEPDDLMGLGGGGIASSAFAPPPLDAPAPPPPPPPQPDPAVQAQLLAAAQLAEPPRKSHLGLIIAAVMGVAVFGAITVYFLMRGPSAETTAAAAVGSETEGDKAEDSSGDSESSEGSGDDTEDDSGEETSKADDDTSKADDAEDDKKSSSSKVASGGPATTSKDDKKDDTKSATDDKKDDTKSTTDDKKDDKKDEPKGEFSRDAARSALAGAAGAASGCKTPGGPTGRGRVSVTFAPSGRATTATVGPPFAGTKTGSCAAAAFRRASVPPFSGGPVTVSKSFTIR